MKKFIQILIILLLIITSCNRNVIEKPTEKSLKSYNLNGKVKSIMEYSNDTTVDAFQQYRFNKNGYLRLHSWFSKGEPIKAIKIIYNSDYTVDSIIEKTKTYKTIGKYFYDDNHLSKIISFKNGQKSDKWNYEYNNRGLKTKEIQIKNDSKINKVETYYRENDTVVTSKFYNSDSLLFTQTTKSNSSSFPIKNKVIGNTIYGFKSEHEQLFKYDQYNNPISTIKYFNGKKTESKTYLYKYDSLNNWVEKVTFSGDSLISTTIREITYYK